MNSKQQHIIFNTLKQMMLEQAPPAGDAKKTSLETDAAPSSAQDSPFTPAEEKFLGKFDAYGSQHLGNMYSIFKSDTCIIFSTNCKKSHVTMLFLVRII